ncbi:hypothetical protein Pcinc_030164 [Petrolisthes cinctipes]|uniref:Tyrosine-protein kinase receptor n=1 Tax=Petrolisthes cinctipes TaxID=88211 RepID=A0AAE1EZE6_PETCI|nr:hypothetical protein Pcinc_030164 [Petrolisthes cinctipes]
MGCVYAAQDYIRKVKGILKTLEPPLLVGGSVNGSSVGLRWTAAPRDIVSGVRFLVQYRQHHDTLEDWLYYDPHQPLNTTQVVVKDLKPYTKYQFRVACLLLPRHPPLMSQESAWISTEASGPPRSPPRGLVAVPLDGSRVEVRWEPPLFPGGDLICYTLYSRDANATHNMRVTINTDKERRYTLADLAANTTYHLNLTSTNHRGEGPGQVVQVTTYPNSPAVDDGEGYLLLTSGHSLLHVGLEFMDTPRRIFNVSKDQIITGMAVHIRLAIIYLSESNGSIIQLLPAKGQRRTLLTHDHIHGIPSDLAIDWLNSHLYYVVRLDSPHDQVWQVWRCGLMGRSPTLIYGQLHYPVRQLSVDPYNGYIWWLSEDQEEPGLHRLPLAPASFSSLTQPRPKPARILATPNLAGLVLDPANFQVLVADRDNNTMLAVSLDGTSVINLRPNTQQAYFSRLHSVVRLNNQFFWTDGNEIYTEELNGDTFYHNSYVVMNGSVGSLVAVHASTQPVPVPLNPPHHLQAVFTRRSASLTWQPPKLPALMGAGAWQEWLYEVHIQESENMIIYRRNISQTSYTATNLRPATFYTVKVSAYSPGGQGPWSQEFRGRTLDDTSQPPQLLWATEKEVLITDLAGTQSTILISQETHATKLHSGRIADLAFYRDVMVMAVMNQSVAVFNRTSSSLDQLPNTEGVLSVAVDWLTQRIFWANPHRQMVGWTSLDGSSQGPLNVETAVREVRVDALHGRLYWTTSHALRSSTLSGRNLKTLHQEGIFSGKQVYGLTVDAVGFRVWWVVRDSDGCYLHSATMSSQKVMKQTPRLLPHTVQVGPMWYLSERLVWLGGDGDVVVSDTSLNSSASLHTAALGVIRFTIILPDLHPTPAGVLAPVVIPGPVAEELVWVEGTWDNFTLTWHPITNMNHGELFYQVVIDDLTRKRAILTAETKVKYESDSSLPPHSPLKVSVRGVSNWGFGPRTLKTLHTPPSLPGPPHRLRTFVMKPTQNSKAILHLRWSAPVRPNGEITGYEVKYWPQVKKKEEDEGEEERGAENSTIVRVDEAATHLEIASLTPDVIYNFMVAAVNTVGKGTFSSMISERVLSHRPVPSLLVVKEAAPIVTLLDADLNLALPLLVDAPKIVWAAPLLNRILNSEEDLTPDEEYSSPLPTLVWMDDNSDIYLLRSGSNGSERILRLAGQGAGMGMDWVGEVVVWGEKEGRFSPAAIKTYDIAGGQTGVKMSNVTVPGRVRKFLVSPMTSQVFLLHEQDGSGGGLQLSITPLSPHSGPPQSFFNQRTSAECNCVKTPQLGGGMTLDTSDSFDPHLYYVASSAVFRADISGCLCEEVFIPANYGFGACTEIAVDSYHLFCHAAANQSLVWVPKSGVVGGDEVHSVPLSSATVLIPTDPATQPLPGFECLVAANYSHAPNLVGSRETAIAIKLTAGITRHSQCGAASLPPLTYVLYYGPVTHNEENSCSSNVTFCQQVRSQNHVITVEGLEPYTRYMFRVAAETVYNTRLGQISFPGPVAIFKTKAKAPESVGQVTAEAVSPEEIDVRFEAVAGQAYEIHWQKGTISFGPLRPPHVNQTQWIKETIKKLVPNTKYDVWVRVYSKDRLVDLDSPKVTVITLPQLPDIKLQRAEARSLLVNWTAPADRSIVRHAFQYIAHGKSMWRSLDLQQTLGGQTHLVNLTNLDPATPYLVRLMVIYDSSYHNYTWPSIPLFNFSTLSETPGEPGQVMRQQVGGAPLGSGLRVWWHEADSHGSPILAYTLQAAPYPSDTPPHMKNHTFTTVYNDSANHWDIQGLMEAPRYIFRVRAVNQIGAGPWGEENVIETVLGPTILSQAHLPTILASTIPPTIFFIALLFTCLFYVKRTEKRRKKLKAAAHNDTSHHPRSREVELATLRQLPTNNNFVTENNVLYNLSTFPGDDLDLPHVSRHCITLTKFLGSGAFGEVFEGTACELPGMPEVTKVAIKTLRKGATESEKGEFLKEAQLMSHFQHQHILRLLAVCTDHDPFFLILELMEGGDLLSYLRTSRGADSNMTLADLVAMCLDVARGCVYLEEMHYVHRDLAARNCLVSTTDPRSRIVKIGDFGLARDIYKNDYYRKEGEGLLPVRWMAPESLVDGVFTSHSDVWAFGVLLWEILTLGQQPYPARTNLEVLHYVRSGGKLNRPPGCPEELHKLMERCWSFSPESRPTFKACLASLLLLEETISALPALAVHNVHYVSSNDHHGRVNLAYSPDREENVNTTSGQSVVSEHECYPSNSWPGGSMGSVEGQGRDGRGSEGSQEGQNIGEEAEEEEEEEEEEECDSFSGASTLPLTSPLKRHQQYLQLVNEPSPQSPPLSPRQGQDPTDWQRFLVNGVPPLPQDAPSWHQFPGHHHLINGELHSPDEAAQDWQLGHHTDTTTMPRPPPRSAPQSPTKESLLGNMDPLSPVAPHRSSITLPPSPVMEDVTSLPSAQRRPQVTSFSSPSPVRNLTSPLSSRSAGLASPSSPLSLNYSSPTSPRSLTSPSPDSPTSVTFTFPLPTSLSPHHYLKPSNNKALVGPSSPPSSPFPQSSSPGSSSPTSPCPKIPSPTSPFPHNPSPTSTFPTILPDITEEKIKSESPVMNNSYVNMSSDIKQTCPNEDEAINGVTLRQKQENHLSAETENHRLSGVSALSALSGTTSASTIDLDHNPSQSWC